MLLRLSVVACLLLCVSALGVARAAGITYEPTGGHANGKHILLISGDDAEYHSEEALPALAKILAVRHGFRCTVLFGINPHDGTIDPREKHNLPGLEDLKTADALILFMRWRDLPDSSMKLLVDYFESGKPVLAIRTGTHPFASKTSSTYAKWNWDSKEPGWEGGFGRHVLGETWVAHHGGHGTQSTRGIFAPEAASNPILRGIADGEIWGPTDTYAVNLPLPSTCHPLVLGQVLSWVGPDSTAVPGKINDPMMPIAWTNAYRGTAGKTARVFTSTIGSADDIENEAVRRLLINATYWITGSEAQIKADANVAFVGRYQPHSFLSEVFTAGLFPGDLRISDTNP
ncbi:MAG: ThuA domain-containing protein [Rhodospirillales bacterium]|nr:ThuA domain-containing protein [Acetobacter sp.]